MAAAPPLSPPASASSSDARWLRFRVRDSGIGVSRSHLELIFEPFVQAEQSTVRRFGGTGLGLTICRRLVRAMGGDLVARSAGMGKGTTLVFAIPLLSGGPPLPPSPRLSEALTPTSDAEPEPVTSAQPEASYAPPPLSPCLPRRISPSPGLSSAEASAKALNVLVAEDDPLSQLVMRKLLGRLGVRFSLVENGALAVDAFLAQQHTPFNIVLLDLHMPLLDGLAAAREMCAAIARGEAPPTPLYALTASCSDEERARCAEAGMVDLIPKPIKLEGLKTLLRKHAAAEARGPGVHAAHELGLVARGPGHELGFWGGGVLQ